MIILLGQLTDPDYDVVSHGTCARYSRKYDCFHVRTRKFFSVSVIIKLVKFPY